MILLYEEPAIEIVYFENSDRVDIRPCTSDDAWAGCGCVAY
ncbi:hypothetical protein [uncultured Phascolarctobacterium sp.]|nr:hypothetical protein [uncultured Phascolarctobacterium sp.]